MCGQFGFMAFMSIFLRLWKLTRTKYLIMWPDFDNSIAVISIKQVFVLEGKTAQHLIFVYSFYKDFLKNFLLLIVVFIVLEIVFTTAHKSKGLEFDTVRLGEDFLQQLELFNDLRKL